MFTDAMRERQQEEIQLNGVSALGLGHLVDYAYTSRLSLDLSEYIHVSLIVIETARAMVTA